MLGVVHIKKSGHNVHAYSGRSILYAMLEDLKMYVRVRNDCLTLFVIKKNSSRALMASSKLSSTIAFRYWLTRGEGSSWPSTLGNEGRKSLAVKLFHRERMNGRTAIECERKYFNESNRLLFHQIKERKKSSFFSQPFCVTPHCRFKSATKFGRQTTLRKKCEMYVSAWVLHILSKYKRSKAATIFKRPAKNDECVMCVCHVCVVCMYTVRLYTHGEHCSTRDDRKFWSRKTARNVILLWIKDVHKIFWALACALIPAAHTSPACANYQRHTMLAYTYWLLT